MSLTKCPFCGELTFGELSAGSDRTYVLTEANETTKEFYPTSGLVVKVMGCASCKNLQFKCPSINIKN
ncbi:MAG: hypothetical protein E6590_17475 [Clostridiales bacterium]|nr:hypothetical protein [Clostridiales bacterium]